MPVASSPGTPPAASVDLSTSVPRTGSPWPHRLLWANLVAQVGIVVTGGAVRLTGSGLGCSTWPQCEPGQFAPVLHEATSLHPYIEFGNRTLTGVLGVLALLTAVVVWRRPGRSRGFRVLGLVPLVGVAVQAVVGGLTVLVDLHPAWVGSHFAISMLLVAASMALVVRHREGDGVPEPLVDARTTLLSRALVPLGAAVVLLGVVTTGAGPHSGDAEVGYRFALDPALVARGHAASVWLFVAGVVALVVLTRPAATHERPRRAARVLLAVTLAQGAVGYVQYFTGLPELLVGVHMLGAAVLVAAQTAQVLSLRRRGPLAVAQVVTT
ncbi:protein required for cytochrome oxidase assembly [Cellulomonas carbonis]|nr:protein required for cytochrome oxidase assembly [Cellulomonas carbonis]